MVESSEQVFALYEDHVMNTYGRLPVVLARGRGTEVWDVEGRRYLDFLAGLAVNNVGHCHPRVVEAVGRQAAVLMHCSNLYYITLQALLAERLTGLSLGGKAFFCNSGTEAVEASLKLARKYGRTSSGTDRYEVIAFHNSFHGRTFGSLSATGQSRYHDGFAPLLPGIRHVPFNDLDAVRQAVTDRTCAILVEPIQGEGGINLAEGSFLRGLREIADERHLALIFDEVQTGFGRTGKMFAYQIYGVRPDIMAVAKGLGAGFPIGAVLATDEFSVFTPGDHAATFGGNPLACAAALAALEVLEAENLPERAARLGAFFRSRLETLRTRFPFVREINGVGLMIGMVVDSKAAGPEGGPALVRRCLERGLLANWTAGRVLRFLPPLTVTEEEILEASGILEDVFKDI